MSFIKKLNFIELLLLLAIVVLVCSVIIRACEIRNLRTINAELQAEVDRLRRVDDIIFLDGGGWPANIHEVQTTQLPEDDNIIISSDGYYTIGYGFVPGTYVVNSTGEVAHYDSDGISSPVCPNCYSSEYQKVYTEIEGDVIALSDGTILYAYPSEYVPLCEMCLDCARLFTIEERKRPSEFVTRSFDVGKD